MQSWILRPSQFDAGQDAANGRDMGGGAGRLVTLRHTIVGDTASLGVCCSSSDVRESGEMLVASRADQRMP
jgi:hypothetical protein